MEPTKIMHAQAAYKLQNEPRCCRWEETREKNNPEIEELANEVGFSREDAQKHTLDDIDDYHQWYRYVDQKSRLHLIGVGLDDDDDERVSVVVYTWPRYDDPGTEAAYEYACEWVCDERTAALICDSLCKYGSEYLMIPAEEWNDDENDIKDDYDCIIGQDVTLDYYVITLK